MDPAQRIWQDLLRLREEAPLVHNITNYVVMNTTANALLAVGASPVMAHALEEVEEMVALARALVLNLGTLSPSWIEAMSLAACRAGERGVPIVLDPVGAGATRFRTESAQRLLRQTAATVIRGNPSEIRALCYAEQGTRGVDSRHGSEEALEAAQALAERHGCVVTVSGATDLIVSGGAIVRVANGHPWMPRVTGLGCTASALIGAFCAVNPDPARAAAHAMAVTGIAGEMAAEQARGPGSFQVHFLDALHLMGEDDICRRLRMEGL